MNQITKNINRQLSHYDIDWNTFPYVQKKKESKGILWTALTVGIGVILAGSVACAYKKYGNIVLEKLKEKEPSDSTSSVKETSTDSETDE